ncbi:MAG: DUF4367 domain-containing protein [Lachnospiraceae bacterium]|nr:DUF4367 domain-containing protein [Lachnospiraceae bacterium]
MIDEQILKESLIQSEVILYDFVEDGKYEFSAKMARLINRLIYREKHPISYRIKSAVAMILFAILFGGSLLLGVSENARASVMAWLSDVFEGTFIYRSQSHLDVDITAYTLQGCVSDAYYYSEADSYRSKTEVCESYIDSDGYYLYMFVLSSSEGKSAQILPDAGDDVKKCSIAGKTIDHYFDTENTSNAYVWQDENGVLFYIGGHISEQKLFDLANAFFNIYLND